MELLALHHRHEGPRLLLDLSELGVALDGFRLIETPSLPGAASLSNLVIDMQGLTHLLHRDKFSVNSHQCSGSRQFVRMQTLMFNGRNIAIPRESLVI
jgi:hypothetical protein